MELPAPSGERYTRVPVGGGSGGPSPRTSPHSEGKFLAAEAAGSIPAGHSRQHPSLVGRPGGSLGEPGVLGQRETRRCTVRANVRAGGVGSESWDGRLWSRSRAAKDAAGVKAGPSRSPVDACLAACAAFPFAPGMRSSLLKYPLLG